jgi:hypothetical protein
VAVNDQYPHVGLAVITRHHFFSCAERRKRWNGSMPSVTSGDPINVARSAAGGPRVAAKMAEISVAQNARAPIE